MTIYFNKSVQDIKISKQKLEMLAKHYKQIADSLSSNEVHEILKKWQGKKYTKRLEKELKKIDRHFYINNTYSYYLNYCFYDVDERSFRVSYTNSKGFNDSMLIYLDTYKHTILHITKSMVLADCNILIENLSSELLTTAKFYQRNYEKLNNQLFELDNIIKDYKELIAEVNTFTDNIQSDIKSEFKMYIINQS